MSNSISKKERIFSKYSKNLVSYIGQFRDGCDAGTFNLLNEYLRDTYLCPLCYRAFKISDLTFKHIDNYLTLEHNPPRSMGGKDNILTCKQCNNGNGAGNDKIVRDLLTTESFLYSKNASISSKFIINGSPIKGRIKKDSGLKGLSPNSKSNPHIYRALVNDLTNGKSISIKGDLSTPDWTSYSFGVLKIAYLQAFEFFGYYFSDLGNGANVRDVLNGNSTYPAPNNGILDIFAPDDFVGVNVVLEPRELTAIIVTIPFEFTHDQNKVKKNVPVVLPAPFEGAWDLLKNYHTYIGKEISFKSCRYTIEGGPVTGTTYYSMFDET